MKYPSYLRTLMGASGFKIQISGRRKYLLLSTLDRLFKSGKRDGREVSVRIGPSTLHLDLANPSERLLLYAAHNLLRSYRDSPLYFLLVQLVSPASLFVDIGANLGLYSFLARELGYETLLFEPEPVHSAYLNRNREAIGTPVACALSDQSGTAEFFVSGPENPGSSSVVTPNEGWQQSDYQQTISVPLRTFDSVLEGHDIGIYSSDQNRCGRQ